jgi:hypothetical protein
MLGDDEDILVDQTRAPGGKGVYEKSGSSRLTEILSRCTVKVGEETRPDGKDRFELPNYFEPHWRRAYTSDRGFSMIRLRQLSLGDLYTFSDTCTNCGKELKVVTVNLADLEVKSIPLEVAQKDSHLTKVPGGDQVQWRFLRGEDEDAVEEIVRTKKRDFVSCVMHRRTIHVNGKKPEGGGLEYMKRMSTSDRRFLSVAFDEMEGGIETDIQITCDKCNVEFSKKLAVMGKTDFFFPSATPSTSSSPSAISLSAGAGRPKLSAASQ